MPDPAITVTASFRLPPDLHKGLKLAAAAKNISLNKLANQYLEDGLALDEAKLDSHRYADTPPSD